MKLFSFNTNKPTKRKIKILAALYGCSQEQIIQEAIRIHVDYVTSDYRAIGGTVKLDKDLTAAVVEKGAATGLSKSQVIDFCMRKYVQENQSKLNLTVLNVDSYVA